MEPFDPFKEFIAAPRVPTPPEETPAGASENAGIEPEPEPVPIEDHTEGQPETAGEPESPKDAAAEDEDDPADELPEEPPAPAPPTDSGTYDFSKLRRRYDGHSPLNELVRDDWIRAIELSPDRFDALLYRPLRIVEPAPAEAGYETPLAGSMNVHQEELSYDAPVLVPILDCPDEMAEFETMDSDDDSTGIPDTTLILRIGAHRIPKGSIVEFEEEINGGTRRVWWYVLNIHNYGTVSAGSLYYCVPCRTFEGVLNNATE